MDRMIKESKGKRLRLAGIYYVIAAILYIVNIFVPAVWPGYIACIVMVGVFAELILKKRLTVNIFEDKLVIAYFIYNTLSVIWLVRSGMPLSVYLNESLVTLIPIVFYFVGRSAQTDSEGKESRSFYRSFVIAILFVVIAGIIPAAGSGVIKADLGFVSFPGSLGQRSEQWVAAVGNMYSTWLGNGLGANGNNALGIEDAFVVSGCGLVKTYCEQGIFGFSMFIYIIILAFGKGLKDIGTCRVELGIAVLCIILSVWSNIPASQLVSPVFWYAIGRMISTNKGVRA